MARTTADFRHLDEGRYRDALREWEPVSGAAEMPVPEAVWNAELALYLSDTDEAERLARLHATADVFLPRAGDAGEIARRAYLVRADAACHMRRLDEAARLAEAVVEGAGRAGSPYAVMRARVILAGVAIRRGDYRVALECAGCAAIVATDLGLDYYRGRTAYLRGYCHNHLGKTDEAIAVLSEAILLLDSTEGARYAAASKGLLGAVLCDVGRPQEALALCEAAERIAIDLGLVTDALWYRVNAEQALVVLGRYHEAVSRFESLAGVEREHQHPAEVPALYWLSIALTELDERDRAAEAARSMLGLAEVIGTRIDSLDARLALGRATRDRDDLATALADSDEYGTERQRVEARIFLAEACVLADPDRAALLVTEARALPIASRLELANRALSRLEGALAAHAVRIEDAVLTVDLRSTWLTAEQGAEVMERFLYALALKRTDGNQRAAARLLGRAESDVSRKRSRYNL